MKHNQAQLVMGYWENANYEELHHRSRLWLSEIAFWKEEMAFMQNLVKNHFVFFADNQYLKETLNLTEAIIALEKNLNSIEKKVQEHEDQLKIVLQMHDKKEGKGYRKEHGALVQSIDEFIEEYKAVKKALFQEAVDVLKSEKMKRLGSLVG